MNWVYIKTESRLWTVGFYAPDGTWHTDSDHDTQEGAAERVAHLNGASAPRTGGPTPAEIAEGLRLFQAELEANAEAIQRVLEEEER